MFPKTISITCRVCDAVVDISGRVETWQSLLRFSRLFLGVPSGVKVNDPGARRFLLGTQVFHQTSHIVIMPCSDRVLRLPYFLNDLIPHRLLPSVPKECIFRSTSTSYHGTEAKQLHSLAEWHRERRQWKLISMVSPDLRFTQTQPPVIAANIHNTTNALPSVRIMPIPFLCLDQASLFLPLTGPGMAELAADHQHKDQAQKQHGAPDDPLMSLGPGDGLDRLGV